jgi:4-diphosphocytidyl-2-C-methyl-D-erythritol kinase
MKVLSPAKINLMLRILGQRDDGYHLLQTYFQILDWGDYMEFTPSNTNNITIHGDFKDLEQQDNLIYKAAKLLKPYNKTKHGIDISIDKNIPQGSGLGGGSSNAGTTLRILNQIWQCNLSQQELQEMAIKLGADVPIFVLNQSAMATGVGENLTPYQIESYYFVLIFPNTSIATIDIFNSQNLDRKQSRIKLCEINNKKSWNNACLEVVLNKYPEVNRIYRKVSALTPTFMSGTGSTLFCCFSSKQKATQFIQKNLSDWSTVLCQSQINQ